MTLPYYVPPEQLLKDRAEYARKGIAKGRPIVAHEYADGILLMGENPSGALHKISEIYDRIAFAGSGRFNEFESLRVAGIRHADVKGFAYGRRDVTAKSLANAYSQTLGQIFTHEVKPYEVQVIVAEVGTTAEGNRLFRVDYDGNLYDERRFCAIGGNADAIVEKVADGYDDGTSLPAAVARVAGIIEQVEEREIPPDGWEAAVVDRTIGTRTFRRLDAEEVGAARG